jgi:hypothetical protein
MVAPRSDTPLVLPFDGVAAILVGSQVGGDSPPHDDQFVYGTSAWPQLDPGRPAISGLEQPAIQRERPALGRAHEGDRVERIEA